MKQIANNKAEFPFEIWEKLAALGILGLPFPEEYGGGGTSGREIKGPGKLLFFLKKDFLGFEDTMPTY